MTNRFPKAGIIFGAAAIVSAVLAAVQGGLGISSQEYVRCRTMVAMALLKAAYACLSAHACAQEQKKIVKLGHASSSAALVVSAASAINAAVGGRSQFADPIVPIAVTAPAVVWLVASLWKSDMSPVQQSLMVLGALAGVTCLGTSIAWAQTHDDKYLDLAGALLAVAFGCVSAYYSSMPGDAWKDRVLPITSSLAMAAAVILNLALIANDSLTLLALAMLALGVGSVCDNTAAFLYQYRAQMQEQEQGYFVGLASAPI